jgi:radical SAM protein with 4Fe4S-binding SPASM domain
MLAYADAWRPLIRKHFGNSVGTSMDYPNRHRRMSAGTPKDYTRQWLANVARAIDEGIEVGVIAVVHPETLARGAEALYGFFAESAGITSFQVNTPFPGGATNSAKSELPLDPHELGCFLVELTDIWLERGYGQGIAVGPSDQLLEHFISGSARLPCFWLDNCANGFVCVSPDGRVSQCDCWAASYEDYDYGNLLGAQSLEELLTQGSARRAFLERPGRLVAEEDCADCEFLSICHGGCPVRAFSSNGALLSKDPYCEAYKMLFGHIRQVARTLVAQERSPALHLER